MKSHDPDNQTNLLLAVILSMALLFTWQIFFAPQAPKPAQTGQPQSAQTQPAPHAPQTPGAPPAPGSAQTGPADAPTVDRATALAASPRVPIDTPALKGSIALKGARIDDLVLKNYQETIDPKSPDVVLFTPHGAPGAYYAEHGWQAAGGAAPRLPDHDTEWRVESGTTLTPQTPVTLVWDNGQGLVFRRTISLDHHYMFTVADSIENKTENAVTLTPVARITRYGTPKLEGFAVQHEGLIGVAGEDGLKEITYHNALKPDGTETYTNKTGGWFGITDKYWASALIPPQTVAFSGRLGGEPANLVRKEVYSAQYVLASVPVAAGQSAKVESHLFAGAKQVHAVERYEETLKITKFNKIIDWGWFYFLTIPLFHLIDWLYKLFGNFGVAILAVTVIVKAAFFPLANKSYESMAKMKKLQPEMEKLKERFKDDKARQQQELMKLYQTQKINPLAGCLPILLQIPVFFALYKVLLISIDMRHAPFFGWIQDLSAPDPTSLFNLFGLLPFALPHFLHIGVWPLLMGITMWLQMQLNPPQPDPTQQMIFNWMPVMFTFLLASFPAGLVIYWTWNNILTLTQQYVILNRQGAEVALLDNLKRHLSFITKTAAWKKVAGLDIWRKIANLEVWNKTRKSARSLAERAGLPKSGAKPAKAPVAAAGAPAPEAMAPVMTEEQAFSTLGLAPGASRREIESAYKTLMKKGSPGSNPPGPITADISKARDVLLRNGRA